MHYKGTGKIHSFKGLLADGEQAKIRIQGSVGAIAWRITKFLVIQKSPGASDNEGITQIWREEQDIDAGVSSTIDFSNDELLASGFYTGNPTADQNPNDMIIIFDNALFVRNIWITYIDIRGSDPGNYYIELEEVKVSAAGMAQLAVAASRRREEK